MFQWNLTMHELALLINMNKMQVIKEHFAFTVSYFHIGVYLYINEIFIPQLISF